MSAVGIAFLVAGYLYRSNQDGTAISAMAKPLVGSLSLLFTALPVAFIAMGLFMIVRGLRSAAKARREPAGTIDRHDR